MIKDTLNQKFIAFKNVIVVINKDGFVSPSNKEGYGINFHFSYEENPGNFEKFFNNITGNDPEKKKKLMSFCGYLLHTFYDYKNFIIILTDAGIKENSAPNGRTGKSLLLNALGKVLNVDNNQSGYIEINGKNFKSNDDRKYHRANKDTSLIHINDIFSWFSIENLFIDMTEGIIVRQMYERESLHIYPKFVMSSNKTLKIEGVSALDRVRVFELEKYYNLNLNPEMEFNQWFFRDWDVTEWNKFYSFMIRSCITYFNNTNL